MGRRTHPPTDKGDYKNKDARVEEMEGVEMGLERREGKAGDCAHVPYPSEKLGAITFCSRTCRVVADLVLWVAGDSDEQSREEGRCERRAHC